MDIHELMQRDPLALSEQDLDLIIAKFRESRGAFFLGNAKAGSTKPKTPKEKQVADLATQLNINLDF